tara:strand:- start:281 stop:529 length:249 start_codon:yes stop_codon:yes gene_type:complete
MFGIDLETFSTLWPSFLGVIITIGVMTLVLVKVMQLMNHSNADGSKQRQSNIESPFDTVQSVKGLLGFQHEKTCYLFQLSLS